MSLRPVLTIAVWCSLAVPAGVHAQTPPAKPDAQAAIKQINADLASADPEARQRGLAAIPKLLDSDPLPAMQALRNWVKPLTDARQWGLLAECAQRAILLSASETPTVEYWQQTRVKALLADWKTEAALAEAKSLFNVASMSNTAAAMQQVAECLNAANPDDLHVVARFKAEQLAGARPPAASRPAASNSASILAGIRVDAKPYEDVIRKTIGEDFVSLTAKGNLLLLADRPADAMEVFDRAYGVASDGQLSQASENIARCMKAQDGTIGRANAWVLSIRPPAKGKG